MYHESRGRSVTVMLQIREQNIPFAETLRTARKEAGYTQLTLSEASGVPRPRICEYEKGKRIPTIISYEKLKTVLSDCAGSNRISYLDFCYERAVRKSA